MWRAILFIGASVATACLATACHAPVALQLSPSGEAIAFGAGAGGPNDACFTCHGLNGEGDSEAARLAGLPAGYIVKQLEDYAGQWRDDPVMTPIAQRLSPEQRLAVARYYEEFGAAPPRASETVPGARLFTIGDPERGLDACASCHASDRSEGLAVPRLDAQPAAYTRAQLLAFKESRRRNDPRDVMGAIARKLTHAQIDAVSDYLAPPP